MSGQMIGVRREKARGKNVGISNQIIAEEPSFCALPLLPGIFHD